ncbi:MAG: glycosyltransferase family 2 protein [Solirubrobacterales bacterium]
MKRPAPVAAMLGLTLLLLGALTQSRALAFGGVALLAPFAWRHRPYSLRPIAFVDSDCVPTPDWIERGLAAFSDARVGTVQGATRPDPAMPRGRWDATQELTSFTGRYEACNLFYRRALLIEAGGFDESIGFFGEDSMAGWAVRRLGYDERFAADAVVHHTVTFPGVRWHWRRGLRYGNWNALVRRFPEMRSVFWHRVFLRRDGARTLAAMLGLILLLLGALTRSRSLALGGVALLAPFVWRHRPYSLRPIAFVDSVASAGFDVAIELALLWGSVRERTLVL